MYLLLCAALCGPHCRPSLFTAARAHAQTRCALMQSASISARRASRTPEHRHRGYAEAACGGQHAACNLAPAVCTRRESKSDAGTGANLDPLPQARRTGLPATMPAHTCPASLLTRQQCRRGARVRLGRAAQLRSHLLATSSFFRLGGGPAAWCTDARCRHVGACCCRTPMRNRSCCNCWRPVRAASRAQHRAGSMLRTSEGYKLGRGWIVSPQVRIPRYPVGGNHCA